MVDAGGSADLIDSVLRDEGNGGGFPRCYGESCWCRWPSASGWFSGFGGEKSALALSQYSPAVALLHLILLPVASHVRLPGGWVDGLGECMAEVARYSPSLQNFSGSRVHGR